MKNQVLHSITVVRASLPSNRRLISTLSLASAGGTMCGTSRSGTPFSRATWPRIASASSTRPVAARKRGDSGIRRRTQNTSAPATAELPSR